MRARGAFQTKRLSTARPQAVIVTASPTTERARHAHAADGAIVPPQIDRSTFRPGWRADDRLARWHGRGLIDTVTLNAARTMQSDLELVAGLPASPLARLGLPRPRPGPDAGFAAMAARIGATQRLRRIESRLGPFKFDLVVLVVTDQPMALIRRRWGNCHRDTARERALVLLAELAQRPPER